MTDLPPNAIETMIIHAARHLARGSGTAASRPCSPVLGQATLMSWLALHRLRDEGIEVALMLETGVPGHDPRSRGPASASTTATCPRRRSLSDIFEILGLHAGGAQNRCIGTIGAAQIDRRGNINSTYAADGSFLTGSGGANDIASTAREVAVVASPAARKPGREGRLT